MIFYAIKQENGLFNIFYNIYSQYCDGIVETGLEKEGIHEKDIDKIMANLTE